MSAPPWSLVSQVSDAEILNVFAKWSEKGCPILLPFLAIEEQDDLERAVESLSPTQRLSLFSYLAFRIQNASASEPGAVMVEPAREVLSGQVFSEDPPIPDLVKLISRAKRMVPGLQ